MSSARFFIGEYQVDPSDNTVKVGKTKRSIEPKAMDVLLFLCQYAGDVVSADDITSQCWPDQDIGDNPVHKAITQLRRVFNDKASAPKYIETIRKRGYRIVAKVTFPQDENQKAAASVWEKSSPYPGLHAFDENQTEIFFGRASAIDGFLKKFEQLQKNRHLLSVILGPSGSGKTSLIQAGVLPRLKSADGYYGTQVVCSVYLDAADIKPAEVFLELASALIDLDVSDSPVFEGYSAASLAEQLTQEPESLSLVIAKNIKNKAESTNKPMCALVVDRAEAILASQQLSESQKEAFFYALDCLATGSSMLVFLLCRNDFYPALSNYPVLMRYKDRGGHFDLPPPTAIELSQMIRLPAVAAALTWETSLETGIPLDEVLCAEAMSHSDGLPLLQYTLQELYVQRQNNCLLYSVYHALGGVEGAIGKKAEQVYLTLPENVQRTFGSVMAKLLNVEQQEDALTSRSVRWASLNTEEEKHFVEAMVENRLFTSYLYQGQACFNVAHEALLRRWQRVVDWVSQHHAALVQKKHLNQQTLLWLNDNKSKAFKLTEGKPLTDALSLQTDGMIALSKDESDLIAFSVAQRSRKRWIFRITGVTLFCLTLFSSLSMVSSLQAQKLAERKRVEAEDLMGYMIGDFADKLRSVRRMDLLDGISQRALNYVEDATASTDSGLLSPVLPPPSFTLRLQHAMSLQAIAEVRYYRDDVQGAKLHYDEAERRLTSLREEAPDDADVLKAAGLNAFWLGQLAFDQKAYGIAETEFTHYLALSQRLTDLLPDDKNAQLEVAYAMNSVGSAQLKLMAFESAIVNFKNSLAIKESLGDPEDELSILYFFDSYSWITFANLHLGRLNEALANISVAESKLKGFSRQLELKSQINESLMYLLIRKAGIHQYLGNRRESLDLLFAAKSYADNLLQQDPKNSIWIRDRIVVISSIKKLTSSNPDLVASLPPLAESEALTQTVGTDRRLPPLLNFIIAYQNQNNWGKSEALLSDLRKHKTIVKLNALETPDNLDDVISYSDYLISEIRQMHFSNLDYSNLCGKLAKITDAYVGKSKHPALTIANVFSQICMYQEDYLLENKDHIESLITRHPEYFSKFIKDM